MDIRKFKQYCEARFQLHRVDTLKQYKDVSGVTLPFYYLFFSISEGMHPYLVLNLSTWNFNNK